MTGEAPMETPCCRAQEALGMISHDELLGPLLKLLMEKRVNLGASCTVPSAPKARAWEHVGCQINVSSTIIKSLIQYSL